MSKFSTIRVKVPDLPTPFTSGNINYSQPNVKEANIKMIRNIKAKYGSIYNKWGEVFEIPDGILNGFIATESGGQMAKPNVFKATGLMQVTPNTVWETVRKFKSQTGVDLPTEVRNEITKRIPTFFTSKNIKPNAATERTILDLLEKDANFNIMVGTTNLRWLLERFSYLKVGQLNKAMVAYNAGAFTKSINRGTNPIIEPIDTLKLVLNRLVPIESRGYLYKMLGRDGFLSLIYKDKVI
jgi:hypothetical protein